MDPSHPARSGRLVDRVVLVREKQVGAAKEEEVEARSHGQRQQDWDRV